MMEWESGAVCRSGHAGPVAENVPARWNVKRWVRMAARHIRDRRERPCGRGFLDLLENPSRIHARSTPVLERPLCRSAGAIVCGARARCFGHSRNGSPPAADKVVGPGDFSAGPALEA